MRAIHSCHSLLHDARKQIALVTLYLRATRAIRSRCTLSKEQQERKRERAKSERANSQPWFSVAVFLRQLHCILALSKSLFYLQRMQGQKSN